MKLILSIFIISAWAFFVNQAPVVDAGSDQSVAGSSITMAASATDDTAVSRYIITKLKAPGQSTFSGAVIGSSTSACFGITGGKNGDSCYVKRVKDYFKNLGLIDTIYNLGQSSTTLYEGMPTGYTPPGGRPSPDPTINFTAAVNKPGVDFLIVNYPSNGYDSYTVAEVMAAMRVMRDSADLRGVKIYFTTTQQREGFSPTEEARLKEIADSVSLQFPDNYIQFWYGFQKEGTTEYRDDFDYGDGTHGNALSHVYRAYQVIAMNPLKDLIPGSHSITNKASQTTTITNLSPGTYWFMVSAVDNDSLYQYDYMQATMTAVQSLRIKKKVNN